MVFKLRQHFVLTLLISAQLVQSAVNYCDLCLEHPKQHTLCLYRPKCPHDQLKECPVKCPCAKYDQKPLTDAQKELILDYHNKYRSRIALGGNCRDTPTAANMNQLEWDNELEMIAQCWANQCQLKSDVCRDITEGYVGQNIGSRVEKFAYVAEADYTLKAIIDEWFNQREHYNPNELGQYVSKSRESAKLLAKNCTAFFKNIDQYREDCANKRAKCYTQLIWADTKRVGCGRVCSPEHSTQVRCTLVCNYFPGGNINNFPVYGRGKPATRCEEGRHVSAKYPGLCDKTSSEIMET